MRIAPLKTKVVLKRIEEEELNFRGVTLYAPQQLEEAPAEAEVLAAGTACKYVKAGDRVLLGRYASSDFDFHGERICVVDEYEILGVLNAVRERSAA